jgi:DNA gyrase subunit A
LEDDSLVREIIKEEMGEIKQKFGSARKTKITGTAKEIDVEDLIADEDVAVTVTRAGYVKRIPVSAYRQQKRGGKGTQGVNLKENDYVEHLFIASTLSYMLFFSSKGKVYRVKVYEIPEASRHARGTAIVNLLPLEKGETIRSVVSTKNFPEDQYLMFATEQGMVKKTSMSLYDRSRRDGLIAINLKEGDQLLDVRRVAEGEDIILVSSDGKAIKWQESEARAMGRDTMGVRGMNIEQGEKLIGMQIGIDDAQLLVVTDKGYGKRTPISDYPSHHRGGKGVYTITQTRKKGDLAAVMTVKPEDEVMLITDKGVIVRTPVKGISELGRSTQGVHIMNVADGDKVIGITLAESLERKHGDVRDGKGSEGQTTLLDE